MELILALASLPYAAKVRFAAVSLIRLMTGRGRNPPNGLTGYRAILGEFALFAIFIHILIVFIKICGVFVTPQLLRFR
jgi:hypothetical protein